MPNWCYNNIEILGEPKVIKRMSAMLDAASNKKKDNFFESLIGVDEKETTESLENGGWYNHNVERYGTKWDISYDDIMVDEDSMVLNTESAWSPPIEGMRILSTMYDVSVKMYYEEPGADFCGKATIQSGNVHEEDYSYQEGIYQFEGFDEWFDREFINSGLEYIVDDFEHGDKSEDLVEVIKDNYPFLKESEIMECVDELKKELATSST
jgi:hypothetical protein